MYILEKSKRLAIELFNPGLTKENQHFSFLFERNKLISIGQNYLDVSSKAFKFAKMFDVGRKKHWPSLHSEIDAISRVWGRIYLDKRIRLVNVRVIRSGQIGLSKPCPDCSQVLDALGLTKIWWTEFGGKFNNV